MIGVTDDDDEADTIVGLVDDGMPPNIGGVNKVVIVEVAFSLSPRGDEQGDGDENVLIDGVDEDENGDFVFLFNSSINSVGRTVVVASLETFTDRYVSGGEIIPKSFSCTYFIFFMIGLGIESII